MKVYDNFQTLHSLPIMNSTHECEQKISTDGHMESVLCHEVHLFAPFSKGNSGVMTEVTQTLKFVSRSTGTTSRMGKSTSTLEAHRKLNVGGLYRMESSNCSSTIV
jgi:hypothetical protein